MQRRFADLKNRNFDLLVVGGGIYGAWTAYDAALRGLSTALVDQGDWAGATSSASTKLIHGGLRHLARGHPFLVRQALAERACLRRIGPHRVQPLRFGVPIQAGGGFRRWPVRLGLGLYDRLGGIAGTEEAHRFLSREQFLARFPWLRDEGLRGGALYADAQTDDTRLVLELVHGAMAAGAVCVNYCAVLELREDHGRAAGAIVKDAVGGEQTVVKARCVVKATGPWLADTPGPGRPRRRLSKGVHLILPPLPGEDALLFRAPADGRVIFLIPWYGHTLLGTTDTEYTGDPGQARVAPEDVAYLLEAANRVLAPTGWDAGQVIGQFAGLRVLRRDWRLEEFPDRSLASVGGRLTSARPHAAAIVDRVCRRLGIRRASATREQPLPWAPAGDFEAFRRAALARGQTLGLSGDEVRWLIFRHGRQIDAIFDGIAANPALGRRLRPELPLLQADLLHCARQEMVVHLEDLLRRRLCLLLLHRPERGELETLAEEVGGPLGWDKARRRLEVECCLNPDRNAHGEIPDGAGPAGGIGPFAMAGMPLCLGGGTGKYTARIS